MPATKTYTRPENWVNKFEIDLKGGQDPKLDAANADWALISQGILTATPTANETDDTQAFWNDKGFSETDATGKRVTFAITGQRVVGDPAQDYIAARFLAIGNALRTLVRWTDQNGEVIISNVTLTAIVPFGGNANARQTFSFTLSLNGVPVLSSGGQNNDDGTGQNGIISGDNVSLGDGSDIGTGNTQPVSKSAINVKDSSIKIGDTWTAKDNFVSATNKDGNATTIDNVTITGTVDTSKAGTNSVTYSIDGATKTATITVDPA